MRNKAEQIPQPLEQESAQVENEVQEEKSEKELEILLKNRIVSDAELISGGAKIKTKDGNILDELHPTPKQKKAMRGEMNAEFADRRTKELRNIYYKYMEASGSKDPWGEKMASIKELANALEDVSDSKGTERHWLLRVIEAGELAAKSIEHIASKDPEIDWEYCDDYYESAKKANELVQNTKGNKRLKERTEKLLEKMEELKNEYSEN